jgi:hypothetical protein
MDGIPAYEAWLRQYVKLAEAGRKLASQLADDARRHGSRMNEQRFSSHAQRLYNEEVYWTLQIQGVLSLVAAQAALAPPPAKKAAKPATPASAKTVRAKQR